MARIWAHRRAHHADRRWELHRLGEFDLHLNWSLHAAEGPYMRRQRDLRADLHLALRRHNQVQGFGRNLSHWRTTILPLYGYIHHRRGHGALRWGNGDWECADPHRHLHEIVSWHNERQSGSARWKTVFRRPDTGDKQLSGCVGSPRCGGWSDCRLPEDCPILS